MRRFARFVAVLLPYGFKFALLAVGFFVGYNDGFSGKLVSV